MSIGGRLFAACYDRMSAGTEAAGLRARRTTLLAGARGRVLEIGAGTGRNLPLYGDEVTSLTLTEPEAPMRRRLELHLHGQGRSAEVVSAAAEDLPFDDGAFDVAVSTLVLCTVNDQARAIEELHRVLVPGGRLLFIEHVRADEPNLARWQDRLNWFNTIVGHGCNCNRATLAAIRAGGFTLTEVEHDELPRAPAIVRPLVIGTATAGPAA